jgi:hypothetical protein
LNTLSLQPLQYWIQRIYRIIAWIFTNIHAITLLSYTVVINILSLKHFLYKYWVFYYISVDFWITSNIHIWTSAIWQYLPCKYKDILHNYFPLKLIGKYLLLYNKDIYHINLQSNWYDSLDTLLHYWIL